MKKRPLALLLTLCMALSLLPAISTPVIAADAEEDIFTALKFDLETPEDYEAETTENPFGKDSFTANAVFEAIAFSNDGYRITGHNGNAGAQDIANAVADSARQPNTVNGMTAMTAGDFNGDGLAGELAYVGIVGNGAGSPSLQLRLMDASGSIKSEKTLCSVDMTRYTGYKAQLYPYLNYLSVAAGDFDGDGYSELAVYVPESSNARVDIYHSERTAEPGGTGWQSIDKWSLAWSHPLSASRSAPNMVSLQAGDFDRDGVDDLAITSGWLYGDVNMANSYEVSEAASSSAIVLFGGKNNNALVRRQEIAAEASICRASFAYGDADGDGVKDLVLGGQPVTDARINANDQRYVGFYVWDGQALTLSAGGVVSVVDGYYNKDGDSSLWVSGNGFDDNYRSLPALRANLAVVKPSLGAGPLVYLDSLLLSFENGLRLEDCLDEAPAQDPEDQSSPAGDPSRWFESGSNYVEYGAAAADVGGGGAEVLLSSLLAAPKVSTIPPFPNDAKSSVGILSQEGESIVCRKLESSDKPISVCFADTDNDTVLMRYTGDHYLLYSDPKVYAVLASAPYFEDVAAIDPGYLELGGHETSYTDITGVGEGTITTAGFSLGAYFGLELFSFELELEATFTFDWERERGRTTEYEVAYSTAAGEDAVVMYSVPTEFYAYEMLIPDGAGGYRSEMTTVSSAFRPNVQVLTLDYYQSVVDSYPQLPSLAGTAVTHTVGDPASYPKDVSGFDVIAFNKEADMHGVSFGGGAIGESITIAEEESTSVVLGGELTFKIGGKYGWSDINAIHMGAAGSAYGGGGWSKTNIKGDSFSGTVANMPEGLRNYGYYYTWKLFTYRFSATTQYGTISIPVISYIVGDVSAPPSLPRDFAQNYSKSTDSSITLDWTYSGAATGFYIYRYFDYPEGGGSYMVGSVAGGDYAIKYVNGKPVKYFSFTDEQLGPYTKYQYQIQVERGGVPPLSGMSSSLSARTKPSSGYPNMYLSDAELIIYPDKPFYLTAIVTNLEAFVGGKADYQWQKLGGDGWTDIPGAMDKTLTFSRASLADNGQYRCRVNVTTRSGNYAISAFTDAARVTYSKRSVLLNEPTIIHGLGGDSVSLLVANAHGDSGATPSGTVLFTFTSQNDLYYAYQEKLDATGLAVADLGALPQGVYTVEASYSGSHIFKSGYSTGYYFNGISEGYALNLPESAEYGDAVPFTLNSLSKNADGSISVTPVTPARTELFKDGEPLTDIAAYRIALTQTAVPGSEPNTLYAAAPGGYTLKVYDSAGKYAQADLSVSRRAVTVLSGSGTVTMGSADPVLAFDYETNGKPLQDELKQELNGALTHAFYSAAGVRSDNPTAVPGYYITRADGEAGLSDRYALSFVTGSFVVTGQGYQLTLGMRKFNDLYTGRAAIVSPVQFAIDGDTPESTSYNGVVTAGTRVIFNAIPDDGYEIYEWYINGNAQNSTARSIAHTMLSEDTDVEVQFIIKRNSLSYSTLGGGSILCDQALASGSFVKAGTPLLFTATAQEGWHFKEWRYTANGVTTYPEGIALPNGSRQYNFEMPGGSVSLVGVFARDSYVVTLSEHLYAYYMGDHDQNSATADQEIRISSGDVVTGDTAIAVRADTGYAVLPGEAWIAQGAEDLTAAADGKSCTFTLTGHTRVSMATKRESYTVTLAFSAQAPEGAKLRYSVGGGSLKTFTKTAANRTLDVSVPGGESFLAEASYPAEYEFTGWEMVDGSGSVSQSGETQFALEQTGGSFTLTAGVVEKNRYNVTLFDLPPELSGASWQVSLNAGQFVRTAGSVTVHEGDTLAVKLTGMPNGVLVGYWSVDGKSVQSTGTYTFESISEDHNIAAVPASTTYHLISWPAIRSELSGGTLTPANGSLPLVSSGESFAFRLNLLDGLSIDKVLATDAFGASSELAADTTGVYTIENIRSNMTISLSLKPLGVTVDGIDISALSGSRWRLFPKENLLQINANGSVVSGASGAYPVCLALDRTVTDVTLRDLTLTGSESVPCLFSAAGPGTATVLLSGENRLHQPAAPKSGGSLALLYAAGRISLRGGGNLTVSADCAHYGSFVGIDAGALTVDGPTVSVSLKNTASFPTYSAGEICGVRVREETGLSMKSGRLGVRVDSTQHYVYGIYATGNVTVDGGVIAITMENSGFAFDFRQNAGILAKPYDSTVPTGGRITVNGGRVEVTFTESGHSGDVCAINGESFIHGGTVTLYGGARSIKGSMETTGGILTAFMADESVIDFQKTLTRHPNVSWSFGTPEVQMSYDYGERYTVTPGVPKELPQNVVNSTYLRVYPTPQSTQWDEGVTVTVRNDSGEQLEATKVASGASSPYWSYDNTKKTLTLYTGFTPGSASNSAAEYMLSGKDESMRVVLANNGSSSHKVERLGFQNLLIDTFDGSYESGGSRFRLVVKGENRLKGTETSALRVGGDWHITGGGSLTLVGLDNDVPKALSISPDATVTVACADFYIPQHERDGTVLIDLGENANLLTPDTGYTHIRHTRAGSIGFNPVTENVVGGSFNYRELLSQYYPGYDRLHFYSLRISRSYVAPSVTPSILRYTEQAVALPSAAVTPPRWGEEAYTAESLTLNGVSHNDWLRYDDNTGTYIVTPNGLNEGCYVPMLSFAGPNGAPDASPVGIEIIVTGQPPADSVKVRLNGGQLYRGSSQTLTASVETALDNYDLVWVIDPTPGAAGTQLTKGAQNTAILKVAEQEPVSSFTVSVYADGHQSNGDDAVFTLATAVTGVRINGAASASPGAAERYAADVIPNGELGAPQEVTWRLTGNTKTATRLTPNTDGSVTLSLAQDETGTSGRLRLTAVSVGTPQKTAAIEIAVRTSSPPPIIATDYLPGGVLGAAYSEQISAVGAPGFTVISGELPAGLSLSRSGLISGVPALIGSYAFTVRAANGSGHDDKSYTITVSAPPTELTVISSAALTITPPAAPAAPQTTIDDAGEYTAGAIIWTPAVSGFAFETQYAAAVTLSARSGYAFTGESAATVNGQAASAALNTDGTLTVSFTFPKTAAATAATQVSTPTAGVAAGIYTDEKLVELYSATAGADIYYTINGDTPDKNSSHYDAPIEVKASLTLKAIAIKTGMTESAIFEAAYDIRIPTVTTVAVSPAAADVERGAQLRFTAIVTGDNSPSQAVTWTLSGAASADTRIDAAGTLTAAPNETAAEITVTAASAADASKSSTARVTVLTPAQSAPIITTDSLPRGRVGAAYELTLTATGSAPITFTANQLPEGLALHNGRIFGTPAKAANLSVTITAKNGGGSDEKTLPLHISDSAEDTYTLTVVGGYDLTNAIDYKAGAKVRIKAVTALSGQRFGGWTASVAGVVFSDKASPETTVTMPASSLTVTANYIPDSGGGGGGGGAADGKTIVIVDGADYRIGTETMIGDEVHAAAEQKELLRLIGAAGEASSVIFNVSKGTKTSVSIALSCIEKMAGKNMLLSVSAGGVRYDLPAAAINISLLLKALGAAESGLVEVTVTIAELANSAVTLETGTLMAPPVSFTLTAAYRSAIRSRKLIREAFLKLLSEKDMQKITVTDIVTLADINRATFYAHYPDVRGVVEEIENEIIDKMLTFLKEFDFSNFFHNPTPLLLQISRYLEEDVAFYRTLITANGADQFMEKLKKIFADYMNADKDIPQNVRDSAMFSLRVCYFAGGIINMYSQWFRGELNCSLNDISVEVGKILKMSSVDMFPKREDNSL